MGTDNTLLYDTVIYARVSTSDQDIDQQKEKLWNYATDDLNADPADIDVLDDKATGGNTERDGYQELMHRVRNGNLDRVVVRSITRLGRNLRDLNNAVHEIVEENGVGLYVVNDGIEIPPDTDQLNLEQKAVLYGLSFAADIEREMIRQRVIDGLRAAERAGKCTTRPPYGFTTDDDGYLQPDEDYRRAVEAILAVEELGWSHRKASRHTGVPRRTIPNILDRRDLYLDEERDADMVAEARDEIDNGGEHD